MIEQGLNRNKNDKTVEEAKPEGNLLKDDSNDRAANIYEGR